MIEEWLPNNTVIECKNMSIAAHNEMLYDEKVKPYLKVCIPNFDVLFWVFLCCFLSSFFFFFAFSYLFQTQHVIPSTQISLHISHVCDQIVSLCTLVYADDAQRMALVPR